MARDPRIVKAEYFYTQPLHFAVWEGHLETVLLLLEGGADPCLRDVMSGDDLKRAAEDRGYSRIAEALGEAGKRNNWVFGSKDDNRIFEEAVALDDVKSVTTFLEADPGLLEKRNESGGTPLHLAVSSRANKVVELLLERGANPEARYDNGIASEASGYAPLNFEAIDLALWKNNFWSALSDGESTARLLLKVPPDVVIAAALGDENFVRQCDDLNFSRPSGKRALSAAVDFGHKSIAQFLLENGIDPNGPEGPNAPKGAALYAAAKAGDIDVVKLLLTYGADPTAYIDASGSAAFIAKTPAIRALLMEKGAKLDVFDLCWLNEDEEVLKLVADNPSLADNPGGVCLFAAVCTKGKSDLLTQLIDAGARTPKVVTSCRSYLLENPQMLTKLLDEGGMDVNLPNWLHATPLHDLCGRDSKGRPRPARIDAAKILMEHGANLEAIDDVYQSTPLAWAARTNLPDMVQLLLSKGASTTTASAPWATPLAWAQRRGHHQIADLLSRCPSS